MARSFRQRRQLARVGPGDGSALRDYRIWQLFSRSVYFLDRTGPDGVVEHIAVDVRFMADAKSTKEHERGAGTSPAAVYRDGVQVARSNLPASFPLAGGVIEVAASGFGLKRLRYVDVDGTHHTLTPHPRSQEGRRARFARRSPALSQAVGALSTILLLAVLALGLLQGAAAISRIPPVAEQLGTFTSPISLSGWANAAVVGIGVCAALERASRMRYHWLIDGAAG